MGDRFAHNIEYSSLCEDEGVPCKVDYSDDTTTKDVHMKASLGVPNREYVTYAFKMSNNGVGSQFN